MTKLNLNETCLLAASGELDAAARRRLDAYLARHPSARARFEQISSDMERLRSLPRAEFTEPQKRLYAAAIKLGIQEKLDQQHRDMLLARRRRLVYGALATISATAAGIVIVVGVLMANKSANEKRQMARAQEVYSWVDIIKGSDQQPLNPYDETMRNVANSIQELQTDSPTAAGSPDSQMGSLLDALASVPGDTDQGPQPWDPGRF